jgi:hypothetical protein
MKKLYFKSLIIALGLSATLIVMPSCNHKSENAYEKYEDGEEENDEYDGPDKAADFETFRSLDPTTGKVPYDKLFEASILTETQKNLNQSNAVAALTPLAWVERGSNSDAVGPSNGNTRAGGEVTSGRIRAVWVDLADPTGKTVWIGGVSGGLWKTNDISAVPATWTLVNDYLSNLAIASICQDPTNTNIMYFSTGESYRTGGAVGGVGVFKSTDHGVTWNLLTNPAVTVLVNSTKILCDNSGNVYVNSQGISVAAGLQRSSDGGANWVSINPFTNTNITSRIIDFEISSTGAMHVVGGFWDSAPGVGGYRYTANPATATTNSGWNTPVTPYLIPTGTGNGTSAGVRVEITTAGNTIYAAISGDVNSTVENINKVAKSIDGGANWTTTNLTASNITDLNGSGGGQGTFSNTIGVDPSNPNNVIVGSLNLLKSTDGGLTFSKLTTWVGFTLQYLHADQHDITWYDNGNKMLVASDGGLFYSTNKGTNFLDKNVGLRLKQFYGVSIHPTSTNYFLAGTQDNGTHQFNGPGLTSSIEVLGGDGGFTGIDQDEPQFQSGAYVYANFRRSSNGGATWFSSGSANASGLFINPYDYDNVGNKVYAGYAAGQFLRWEDPHSGFNFVPVTVPEFGTGTVTSTTVSPTVANRVYFGVFPSKVYKLDNAQANPTVTDITPASIQASTYITCVAEGLVSNQNLLATQSRTTAGNTHVWSSNNGGTSWIACDGNLPNIPVYWAVYHPDGDTKAYIATETGVWSTDLLNGAATVWSPETTFPTVKTTMLKYRASDRTIAASTYGRGLWTATIPNTSCTAATISTQPINANICSGSNTTFTIVAAGSAPLTYQWQVSTAGAGGPWTNIINDAVYSNATTNTLTITAATSVLSTNQYRCVVSNCATTPANSNPEILTVTALPNAPVVVSPVIYCQNATAIPLTATGTSLLWYTSPTGGTSSVTAPTPSTTAVGNTVYYVSQTVGSCEGPRSPITVNVIATPSAPAITNAITSYCQGATAVPLIPAFVAPGPDPAFVTKWYTVPLGGVAITTAPTPSTTTLGSTIYYVSLSNGICEGPRTAMTVNITAVPLAPTVTSSITYCQGVTATSLTATGTNLLWYTTATGGTGSSIAPTPNTAVVGTTSYFVSQTTGCEGPRATVDVTIVPGTPAPVVISPVAYCQGTTATALGATGTNLLWYSSATGGPGSATAPTPSTTTAGSITYYVSQTSGTCESPRASITVNVTASPLAPTVTPVSYCIGATSLPLTAVGTNLLWYSSVTGGPASTTAPTPSTSTVGNTTYYVSQTINGCESPRAIITVTVNPLPTAPTVTSPLNYCQNIVAPALTAVGTNLIWYATATAVTGSSIAPTPSTATVGSTTYYVSQTISGCEGPRVAIVVNVNAIPPSPTVTSPLNYCQNIVTPALTAIGTNLQWYSGATGGLGSATSPIPSTNSAGSITYYVSQTINGCESQRASIVVNVAPVPVITTQPVAAVTCGGGSASFSAVVSGTGLNYQWQIAPNCGSIFSNIPGATSPTLNLTNVSTTQNGFGYRLVVTGTCIPTSLISNCVNLTINAASNITLQPQDATICSGNSATFTTLATGASVTYQWQISTDGGGSFTNITGATNASYTLPAVTVAMGGHRFRALVSSTCAANTPTSVAILTVPSTPAIITQPVDIISCTPTATFSSIVTGSGITYQWQISTDGGANYSDIPGANSGIYTVSGLSPAQSSYKYRLFVTSTLCGTVISNSVSAKLGLNPVVVLTAAPSINFNPSTNGGLYATVSPTGTYTYQWKRNNTLLSNTGTSITKANGLLNEFGTYQVIVTDPATNCSGNSNTVVVNDIVNDRDKLFVAPNPTTGLVTVTYYGSSSTAPQARIINIYDEKGVRVFTKSVTLIGTYGSTTVDISKFPSGTYVFVIRDSAGKKLSKTSVVKY